MPECTRLRRRLARLLPGGQSGMRLRRDRWSLSSVVGGEVIVLIAGDSDRKASPKTGRLPSVLEGSAVEDLSRVDGRFTMR